MSHTDTSEPRHDGFSLIELLVSMIAITTMMVGVAQLFLLQHHTHAQQEQRLDTEENLRLASSMITDALRNVRYTAPSGNSLLTSLFPALTNSNPVLGTGGHSISLAACFKAPVANLSANYVASPSNTTLQVNPVNGTLSSNLDTSSKSLIRVGEGSTAELATVTGVGSNTINIATALLRNHYGSASPGGANICRVDMITFSIANNQLLRDDNQGAPAAAVADNITDLTITLPTAPKTYQVALTARPSVPDPVTGATAPTRQLSTTVTVRN